MSQQWRWSPSRLVERVTFRISTADRLRALEIAEQRGVSESEVLREAYLRGLDVLAAALKSRTTH